MRLPNALMGRRDGPSTCRRYARQARERAGNDGTPGRASTQIRFDSAGARPKHARIGRADRLVNSVTRQKIC